jgi:Tfp pilus assembly protein PilF
MKKVLEMNPQHPKVWFEAACLAEEMCDYDLAREYLDKAI